MGEPSYQVIFTGQFAEGQRRKEILSRLAVLLRKEPAELRTLFHGAGAVIVGRTSLAMAQKFVSSLNQTGALCAYRETQPQREKTNPYLPPSPPDATTSDAPATEAEVDATLGWETAPAEPKPSTAAKRRQPWTLLPLPGPPDIGLSPQLCANAGGFPGGLTTNRKDWATLRFADIKLLAAFKTSENLDEIKLLLFPHSNRRPLLLEGNTIAFAQFPGVADGKLFATFRKFLILIYRSNPRIALDHATAQFMKGAPPPHFAKDPVILISDLHRAYVAAAEQS